MKLPRLLACLPLLALAAAPAIAEDNVPPAGFTALFNGKDLSGWYGWDIKDPTELSKLSPADLAEYKKKSIEGPLPPSKQGPININANWKVENGELVSNGIGLFLTSDKVYGDFELLLDYKALPDCDAGVCLRGIPQVQIWDTTKKDPRHARQAKGSGGLASNNLGAVGTDPSKKMDKPLGEWNSFKIRMIGERVTVVLNGETVVDHAVLENSFASPKPGSISIQKESDGFVEKKDEKVPNGWMADPAFPKGPIQLRTHGSEMRWRNIFIREIPAEEANKELASRDAEGFVEKVNGKDLSNWQGAVDSYEMKNGAIVCRPGKGGNLFTMDEFENGFIRVEFKLPPAGNNGIALRTPLGGHPSSDGFEIQILDSDGYNAIQAAAGKKLLEPYQYHGSLYNCVGAKHGYLRPVGEWNFEEIEVQGQKIKVTLNGTKILDVDVDTFDRSQIAHPPKGLDHRRGYIGFAGHNDPVEFRSFKVKTLP